jgi:predicted nucleic-acid-binding Zn-ribbon protein
MLIEVCVIDSGAYFSVWVSSNPATSKANNSEVFMAISRCVSCKGTSFEISEANVSGTRFKLNFVQCALCGAVVGVTEFYNSGSIVKGIEAKVELLESYLLTVNKNISVIASVLDDLLRRN